MITLDDLDTAIELLTQINKNYAAYDIETAITLLDNAILNVQNLIGK
jgi:hypothetical protein